MFVRVSCQVKFHTRRSENEQHKSLGLALDFSPDSMVLVVHTLSGMFTVVLVARIRWHGRAGYSFLVVTLKSHGSVYGLANIEVAGRRTGAAFQVLTGTNPRTGSQWYLTQPSVAG